MVKRIFIPLLKMWELTIQNQDTWKCIWITQSNKTSIEKIINNFYYTTLPNIHLISIYLNFPLWITVSVSFLLPCLWILQRNFRFLFFFQKRFSCFCLVQLGSYFLVIKSATVLGILLNTHQTNQRNEHSKRRNKSKRTNTK